MATEGTVSYKEDTRTQCKYGERCYQKNPTHHAKFKHPPKKEPALIRKHKLADEIENQDHKKQCFTKTEEEINIGNHHLSTVVTLAHDACEPDLPASPQDIKDSIKQKFLVEMPEDFYSFWDFCKNLNSSNPEGALQADTGLQLVGPFDVLSGKIKALKPRKQSAYLTHYRYYYDPPEFQTVIKGDDETQFHLGYFRDDAVEKPVFVAENEAARGCALKPLGENLFAAMNALLENRIATSSKNVVQKLEALKLSLQNWAKKSNFTLERKTSKMKARDKNVVTKSFHGAGIVVPYDKKSQVGYRPLPESDGNLRKLLKGIACCKSQNEKEKRFDNLQEIITLVQFANDELDYGMGFELAIDLFCFGDPDFHPTVSALLPLAYELLHRFEFAKISRAHLANRVKIISGISDLK